MKLSTVNSFSKQSLETSSTSEDYVEQEDAQEEEEEEEVEELAQDMQTLDVVDEPTSVQHGSPTEHVKFADDDNNESVISNNKDYYQQDRDYYDRQDYYSSKRSSSPFQYNKRQTGKKNISSIIVGDDNKIEFDQIEDKGFGVVKINRPIGMPGSRTYEHLNDNESTHSRDSEQTHTADGFFDLKFYSHPLW